MPKVVVAQAGDTLCLIAGREGFENCLPLRAEGANAPFLNRPLEPGDNVTVPDVRQEEQNRPTDARHRFRRKRPSRHAIRFVHGSPDRRVPDDDTLTFLNISNYVTNLAGRNGRAAFPRGFGFNANGHADPDTFKVEVMDNKAGGSVDVQLEALMPVYRADGTIDHHESFTDADAALRRLTTQCQRQIRDFYRSRYLRLVTDDRDKAARNNQTLLVSDMADGNNGDADKVEILDQKVRASYEVQSCPANPKCTVRTQIEVGSDKQRIRLAFHVFRTTVGGGNVGGITPQMLRRRTFKWFRRTYAQAGMAPKLVAPTIEFLDPPPDNMLVISQDTGRSSSGVDGAGAASTITFDLTLFSGTPPAATTAPARVTVNLNPTGAVPPPVLTPTQVGARVIASLPAGFSGRSFTNARAFNAPAGSCDILITHSSGQRVVITNEATTDTGLTPVGVAVARVNINSVNTRVPNNSLIPAAAEQRRVVYAAPGADDRLDCYVVGALNPNTTRGIAMVPATDLPAGFRAPAPVRNCTVMGTTSTSGAVLDLSDNLPFTFPHEAAHVMMDSFHTDNNDPNGPTELLSGTGTSQTNAVGGTKRICDDPVRVRYDVFDPAHVNPNEFNFVRLSAVERLRARGGGMREAW